MIRVDRSPGVRLITDHPAPAVTGTPSAVYMRAFRVMQKLKAINPDLYERLLHELDSMDAENAPDA